MQFGNTFNYDKTERKYLVTVKQMSVHIIVLADCVEKMKCFNYNNAIFDMTIYHITTIPRSNVSKCDMIIQGC